MDSGSLSWMMVCTALVLFMTPGLALFYGGLTRTKSTLNMMMMSLWCILVVPLVWVVLGYTLAFRSAGPFIGNLSAVGLRGISPFENVGVPEMAFVAFLATFAAITPALISGAVADRDVYKRQVVTLLAAASALWFPHRRALSLSDRSCFCQSSRIDRRVPQRFSGS